MPRPTRTLPPNAIVHPIWALRFFIVMPMLLLAVAFFVSHNENLRGVCIGAAFGLLIGAAIFALQVQDITLKTPQQPSDADHYSLT